MVSAWKKEFGITVCLAKGKGSSPDSPTGCFCGISLPMGKWEHAGMGDFLAALLSFSGFVATTIYCGYPPPRGGFVRQSRNHGLGLGCAPHKFRTMRWCNLERNSSKRSKSMNLLICESAWAKEACWSFWAGYLLSRQFTTSIYVRCTP